MSFEKYLCQASTPIAFITSWSIAFLGCLLNILFGARGIYKAIKSHKNKDYADNMLYISITALFIASSISYILHLVVTGFCRADVFEWSIIRSVSIFLYLHGLSLLYLFYILRLHKMFTNTDVSLSLRLRIICLFGYFMQCVCIFGVPYGFIIMYDTPWGLRIYLVYLALNFAFNVLLLYIFVRKIHQIAQITVVSHQTKKYTSSIIKLQRLLTPAIRMIICAFIAMISSNLLGIIAIYRLETPDTLMLWVAHVALATWDMFINILCLYLQFSFGDRLYHRCCRKIHLCVYAMFVRRIDSSANLSQTTSTMDAHMQALQYPLQPEKRDTSDSEESTHGTVTETTGLKLSRITE
eukprot:241537_1